MKNPMDYSTYKIEDFVQDESFSHWVLHPVGINRNKWERILIANPDKSHDIEVARGIVLSFQSAEYKEDIDQDAKKIWEKLQPIVRGENQINDRSITKRESTNKFFFKVAASIILVSALSFWYFQPTDSQSIASQEVEIIKKVNPKGRRSTIKLKDGSTVILNSESSLSYASDFGESVRELTLTGEAFFEVSENPHKPFIVRSGNITTTALGTSFNISNFPNDERITVSLATGKVKVEEVNQPSDLKDNPYLLIPGEQISYSVDAKKFEKLRNEDDEDYLWKDGIISLKHADLDEVVEKLERWYGVKIEIGNQSNSIVNYDGIFNNQSLENVLKAMSFSLNFKYSIDQETIKIMFN